MPKQLRFYGRYNQAGKPEGYSKEMAALVAESMAGYEVEIVFIRQVPKPSPGLRGFFVGIFVPWFMEVMAIEEGWELNPKSESDNSIARTRMFLASEVGELRAIVPDDGKGFIAKLPRFSEMDEEDIKFVIRWATNLCRDKYRRTMPAYDKEAKHRKIKPDY